MHPKQAQTEELFIGLMSGTSMDGIDATLVAFKSASQLRVIETQFTPYPDALRNQLNQTALNNSELFKSKDSPLHTTLVDYYADASLSLIEKAKVEKNDISAIANHGQTVRHEPNLQPPFSLQLGDGQLIANTTSLPTITQFRQADLNAGGQGAPLMPAFHSAIFGQSNDTVVLNLGGIANITHLGKKVIGFDTGPSNCLMDQWIEQHQGKRFDQDGTWAASGNVIEPALATLMQDAYLHLPYPKSTGTDYFNLNWLATQIPDLDNHNPTDIQATLLAFTVETIALALEQLDMQTGKLFVCGGGAQNATLISALKKRLGNFSVDKTDALGVPSDWLEAVGFAWLGYCHVHNIPSNLPSVTGATEHITLGQRYLPE